MPHPRCLPWVLVVRDATSSTRIHTATIQSQASKTIVASSIGAQPVCSELWVSEQRQRRLEGALGGRGLDLAFSELASVMADVTVASLWEDLIRLRLFPSGSVAPATFKLQYGVRHMGVAGENRGYGGAHDLITLVDGPAAKVGHRLDVDLTCCERGTVRVLNPPSSYAAGRANTPSRTLVVPFVVSRPAWLAGAEDPPPSLLVPWAQRR